MISIKFAVCLFTQLLETMRIRILILWVRIQSQVIFSILGKSMTEKVVLGRTYITCAMRLSFMEADRSNIFNHCTSVPHFSLWMIVTRNEGTFACNPRYFNFTRFSFQFLTFHPRFYFYAFCWFSYIFVSRLIVSIFSSITKSVYGLFIWVEIPFLKYIGNSNFS